MNHLAQAFGIEAFRSHRPPFFIELGKKNNIQFISPALSCLLPPSTTNADDPPPPLPCRTHRFLKVILCKPSFLLTGLSKANIWRVQLIKEALLLA